MASQNLLRQGQQLGASGTEDVVTRGWVSTLEPEDALEMLGLQCPAGRCLSWGSSAKRRAESMDSIPRASVTSRHWAMGAAWGGGAFPNNLVGCGEA